MVWKIQESIKWWGNDEGWYDCMCFLMWRWRLSVCGRIYFSWSQAFWSSTETSSGALHLRVEHSIQMEWQRYNLDWTMSLYHWWGIWSHIILFRLRGTSQHSDILSHRNWFHLILCCFLVYFVLLTAYIWQNLLSVDVYQFPTV